MKVNSLTFGIEFVNFDLTWCVKMNSDEVNIVLHCNLMIYKHISII